ncbi:MAG: DUF721 domain-containing protein [Acidobacteria bacterium]|nr:MAG: DUF721 domain-containing protein [Acidobacteriota bacterium]REK02597.1 MAG: DUF721 domain-containing protein [Acidobacteriota bacterium]REK13600.1 MAG: DUF721 domain-containing protein [Acidobacteriota bacterium]REK41594.1 MAG: DUF721 domain-containing protein [Acidobacteriota bacterium]
MEGVFRTIPALLGEGEIPEEMLQAVLFGAWRKVAGESLSRRAVAIGLEDKVLKIAVGDLTWKRHLESLSGQMIFRLNSLLRSPAVTYLEFVIDEEALRTAATVKPGVRESKEFQEAALRARDESLEEAAAVIEDAELKEVFLAAASNCIARKELIGPRL